MDETTTSTSSSSAAAVADSASAAASSKTTVASTTSVKLLIKASNQQFADQIIESADLLWTVKRLKTQLSLMYPSKPPVADQKLIYSGQLLNDTLQLKDVIRSYKDVYTQNHIFHLVYTPKNTPAPNLSQRPKVAAATVPPNMSSNAGDGLRQRHVPIVQSQQQQPQQQHAQQQHSQQFSPFMLQQQMLAAAAAAAATSAQCPQYDPAAMPFGPLPGQFNLQAQAALATQQAAMYSWMQQVYAQYMEQYARLSNTASIPAPHPFLFQQLPFMSPNAAATPPSVIPTFPSAAAAGATFVAAPQEAAAAAEPAVAAAEQPQQHVAAPRFPNIVQDEADNRDWLDSFFSITRLAIFLTILYFNSSPLRCLVVVIIAGIIYLYHIGVLRLRNERNNNNINRNNNAAAAAAAADQIRQGVQQVQAAQQQQENPPQPAAANDADDAAADPLLAPRAAPNAPNLPATAAAEASNAAAEEGVEEENQSTSVISFVRTFVVTFFTSLLPETPAL